MTGLFIGLAAKNLTRHRRRTIITAVAMAVGIALYISMNSLLTGFTSETDRNLQEFELGSAAYFAQGYWEEREQFPLDILIEDPQPLLERLSDADIPAAPHTAFRGELIVHYDPFPEDGSITMAFTAVDPQLDPDVFRLEESITDGRFLQGGEEIIIGRWLADRLGAEVGYPVSVTTRTRDGFRQLMDLEIVGIYQTSNPQTDRHTAYVPMHIADEFLEMRGAVTSIYTLLPEQIPGTADLQPLRDILASSGQSDSVELLGFNDMTTEFAEVEQIQDQYTGIMMMLLGIIAIVGISNTILMSVLERQKEIGMLRSMGMRNREIRSIFMFEAGGIGIIGAAGGLLLGSGLVWLLTNHGIDYGAILEDVDLSAFRFEGVLYGVWDFGSMVTVALFAIVVAAVVAMLPTRRILKKSITECLRQS